MQDITITRRGHYLKSGAEFSGGNQTHLLHSETGMEAIVEIMPKGTIGCFYTMSDTIFELNYILKGKLEIMGIGDKVVLSAGDTYSYHALKRNYMFRILEDAEVLGVNTNPYFDEYSVSVDTLNNVLKDLQDVDGDTLNHCTRVKELCMGIAYFMRFDQTQLLNLFYASKFHDVGKAKIPPEILLKPGKLTNDEYEIMKKHSRYTYEMIREHYGEEVAKMAFVHHERLDAKGYPMGIGGDDICLGGRIICVADAYDAMTVTRPYRVAMTQEAAILELRRWQDIQFDSTVIDALEVYLNS